MEQVGSPLLGVHQSSDLCSGVFPAPCTLRFDSHETHDAKGNFFRPTCSGTSTDQFFSDPSAQFRSGFQLMSMMSGITLLTTLIFLHTKFLR
jgi:hypothetical protein